jgi:hypothetical protein
MSKMFPDLTFKLKYYEMGNGFKGVFVCKGGKVIKSDEFEYRGGRGG